MQVELKCGVTVSISENMLHNAELFDLLCDVYVDKDVFKMSKMIRTILSEEDKKAVYDALRLEDGTVPIEKVFDAISEIFTASGETGKN